MVMLGIRSPPQHCLPIRPDPLSLLLRLWPNSQHSSTCTTLIRPQFQQCIYTQFFFYVLKVKKHKRRKQLYPKFLWWNSTRNILYSDILWSVQPRAASPVWRSDPILNSLLIVWQRPMTSNGCPISSPKHLFMLLRCGCNITQMNCGSTRRIFAFGLSGVFEIEASDEELPGRC